MILTFKAGGNILEIEGGSNPLKNKDGGRITLNMNHADGENVDIVHSIIEPPYPFKDNEFDGIFVRYILDQIPTPHINNVLQEFMRIMNKNSKLITIISKKIDDESIYEIFKKNGFRNIKISKVDYTNDNLVEVFKIGEDVFEREYFEDGTIGYLEYRDFATHHSTLRKILQTHARSVVELGGGRGYITKLLENEDIKALCIDISKHCQMTRATDSFLRYDLTKKPIPLADKQFDLAFSINFFEHIPEEKIRDVIEESIRISKAGFHGIHYDKSPYEETDKDIDITHHTIKPLGWWEDQFKQIDPTYPLILKHPREIEYEKPECQPPITIMPPADTTKTKLNIGCFKDMFYYGWINIDIIDLTDFAKKQGYIYKQIDITQGIPYQDNNVDLIFTSHMLEHITREEGKKFLKECYRVLKPDGIIRISVPDTRLITQKYLDGEIMEYKYINVGVETADDEAEAYYNLLLAGHKTIYDQQALCQILKKTGFQLMPSITPFTSNYETIKKETITTHPNISLIIEANKRC